MVDMTPKCSRYIEEIFSIYISRGFQGTKQEPKLLVISNGRGREGDIPQAPRRNKF